MQKKYQRKEFLKLALLANIGLQTRAFNFLTPKENATTGGNLPGENVVYYKKGDAEYETLRKGFNKRIDKFPLIIALCKNTAGVSEAMQYAIKNNLPVAVKSGGHCMEGFSCNNGGMVINLSLLNSIEWINNDTIKVGPGCTLSKLYDEILPKGKIVPGGSCGGVGIGGLVLGGGYGLLGRKYGLTCDSLQEITMVDGKGTIQNSNTDKELLWACKGGGNGNFGVVTELKFKVHNAPSIMQSFRFKVHNVTVQRVRSIMKQWFEAVATLPNSCFSAFVLNRKTVYILLTNAERSNTAIQNTIDTLTKITDKTTHSKPQALGTALKVFYGRPLPLNFKNASAGLYKSFADIDNCIDKAIEAVANTPGMIYQVNTLGGNIQNSGFETNASFPHRAFPYFSELQTYWENESQAPKLLQKFKVVQELFIANGITTQYRNYPDINFKNWDVLYYGSNYARLQQIKNKYDPHNIIRHEQSIKNS